jgi:pimeloyl-ACP methyl ester carboxylesterase
MELIDLWQHAASTGNGWHRFQQEKTKLAATNIPFFQAYRQHTGSLEEARWDWDHILSFDSSIALKHVHCPVLGLFGELDPLTNVPVAAARMQTTLETGEQQDFLVKVIPNAGHSLAEMPSHARMAPGVFETLRSWLRDHVDLPKPQ